MDYLQAFGEAMGNEELVANYDRLNGSKLGELFKRWKSVGTEGLSDEEFDRLTPAIQEFDRFFHEFIWSRLPPQAFTASPSVN